MICHASRLPVLSIGNRETDRYGTAWVRQVIQSAAADAGHRQWVFAQDVALGVIEYLQEKFTGQQISLVELGGKIARTLEALGFPDIADHVDPVPPPAEISLADLARQASPGVDLLFFHLLDQQIRDAAASGADSLRLTGLGPCLRILGGEARSRRKTSRSRAPRACDHAQLPGDLDPAAQRRRDEILAFVTHRAGRRAGLEIEVR